MEDGPCGKATVTQLVLHRLTTHEEKDTRERTARVCTMMRVSEQKPAHLNVQVLVLCRFTQCGFEAQDFRKRNI